VAPLIVATVADERLGAARQLQEGFGRDLARWERSIPN
jgi:hypothetical protein